MLKMKNVPNFDENIIKNACSEGMERRFWKGVENSVFMGFLKGVRFSLFGGDSSRKFGSGIDFKYSSTKC